MAISKGLSSSKSKTEIWKTIEGFPKYQVSNLGRVKRRKVLKAYLNSGYLYVTIANEFGAFKTVNIARLMLIAFDRPPKFGEVARHLDDIRDNNVLENLAWGTSQDNSNDAVRNDRMPKGSQVNTSKLTAKQVLEIKQLWKRYSKEFGTVPLARKYGVTPMAVHFIVSGKNWKHL